MKVLLFILIIICELFTVENHFYNIYNGIINEVNEMNISVRNTSIIFYEYNNLSTKEAALRVYIECDLKPHESISIIIKQDNSYLLSMELFQINNEVPVKAARTIHLFNEATNHNYSSNHSTSIEVSSKSLRKIAVKIQIKWIDNFLIKLNQNQSVSITIYTPVYYLFKFDSKKQTIVIHVQSKDEICMNLGIQNHVEPVQDDYRHIKPYYIHQTMSKETTLVIKKGKFISSNSILIIFMLNKMAEKCANFFSLSKKPWPEMKHFNFHITELKTDYMLPIFLAIGFYLSFYVIACLAMVGDHFIKSVSSENRFRILSDFSSVNSHAGTTKKRCLTQNNPECEKKLIYLSDLTKTNPMHLEQEFFMYIWYLIVISIFNLPSAIQMIWNFYRNFITNGNQDICFYNFRCARPFFVFPAFNNMISNIGYILLGILFLLITWKKHQRYNSWLNELNMSIFYYGLPKYFGLYYAMGFSLLMEGIMSALYHVCPNQSHMIFDQSYKYILVCIMMVQIYQFRHFDITASAHLFYISLAIFIFIGVIHQFFQEIIFWSLFTVLYMFWTAILMCDIYYFDQFKINIMLPKQVYLVIKSKKWKAFIPTYKYRMVIVVFALIINGTISIYGILIKPEEFPLFFLTFLSLNLLIYFGYYIVMKAFYKETFNKTAIFYSIITISCWAVAVYCFIQPTSNWRKTPAVSREQNKKCIFLDFYDIHDISHFLFSIAIFFTFLTLQNMDNCLENQEMNNIKIF